MFRFVAVLLVVENVLCGNVVEVLQTDGENRLINLVKAAGLADALLAGNYTIFAPTNDAFNALGTDAQLSQETAKLAELLKYHVVAGVIPSSAAQNELQLVTLAGTKLRFNIYHHNQANTVTVEGVKVVKVDLSASNGMIHVIDKVMTPPTGSIVDLVAGNNDFSTLLSLVKSAGLVDALKGDNLTVFAPSNAAFAKLGQTVTDKITGNADMLKDILLYHVVPHTEYSAGLWNREPLRTLDAHHDRVRVHVTNTGVKINAAHVTTADISVTNGVVHVIDAVLVPGRYALTLGFGK